MIVNLKRNGKDAVVHKVLGEKLIAKKRATEVKGKIVKPTLNFK